MKPYSEICESGSSEQSKKEICPSPQRLACSASASSVKRFARIADRGASLTLRKGGGRPPKAGEAIRRLLEEDVKERSAATVKESCRFLQGTTGNALSYFSVGRLLRWMGFSRKKDCEGAGTRRVAQSCLESDGRCTDWSEAACFRG